ncbi:hypothetical protein [Frankia sp. Cas3]|uniref:hypothetical protein n=1 Tax=Frankia sp. Cas3 TaxID=3073926 RepID=UPI002AD1DBE0|nr:hypothetical protein [Frankia sp. Cas3]
MTVDTVLAAGAWAVRAADRMHQVLSRDQVPACTHLISDAVRADIDADLSGGAGLMRIPPPRLCPRHPMVRCVDCHGAHVAAFHASERYRRCELCRDVGAALRTVDVVLTSVITIVDRSIRASMGGRIVLDPGLRLCVDCAPRIPQDQLETIYV